MTDRAYYGIRYIEFENKTEEKVWYLLSKLKIKAKNNAIRILKEYHRRGIDKALFEKAIKNGYSFIQVKTVKIGIHVRFM